MFVLLSPCSPRTVGLHRARPRTAEGSHGGGQAPAGSFSDSCRAPALSISSPTYMRTHKHTDTGVDVHNTYMYRYTNVQHGLVYTQPRHGAPRSCPLYMYTHSLQRSVFVVCFPFSLSLPRSLFLAFFSFYLSITYVSTYLLLSFCLSLYMYIYI